MLKFRLILGECEGELLFLISTGDEVLEEDVVLLEEELSDVLLR